VSQNSHDYGLQVSLITASKCISKLARIRPRSVFLSSLDYGLQVRWITASKRNSSFVRLRPPSSHDDCLQVYLQSRTITASNISNNPCFRLKHPGVPDGSDETSYPLTENYPLPVAQATGRISYLPPLLCAWYTHHQNDTCITLFAGAAVML